MATQTITAALGAQHWFDQEASANSNAQATV